MTGLGTIVNSAFIIAGSLIGLVLKSRLQEKYKNIMIQGAGLTVMTVGITGSVEGFITSGDKFIFLVVVLSIALGAIIGTFLQIEKRLEDLGGYLQDKFSASSGNFSRGFVSTSIIFCTGAMAIVGAINDGVSGDYSVLFLKAVIDGIISMVLASSLGLGVLFSFIPVFLYQGFFTYSAYFFGKFIPDITLKQVSIVGNILVIGIGLSLMEIKKIKVADMIPAIFIPIVYYFVSLIFI